MTIMMMMTINIRNNINLSRLVLTPGMVCVITIFLTHELKRSLTLHRHLISIFLENGFFKLMVRLWKEEDVALLEVSVYIRF